MPEPRFRVTATALNLRSAPVIEPSTRLAVLPHGHQVARLAVAADDPDWWRVATHLGGTPVEGFVAHRFLAPVDDFEPPPPVAGLPPAHLRQDRPDITRRRDGGRAYPLGEAGRPRRRGATAAERAAELTAIVDWLGVDDPAHRRYPRQGSTTFCNIYAYDYCYLAGVYLPRVWWTGPALNRLGAGETVMPLYGDTVRELTANELFDWLLGFGPAFGWRRLFDETALQESANAGEVCVICAQRVRREQSGHITAVVPEVAGREALRRGATVTTPLQSQAGWNTIRYGTPHWWSAEKFREAGFWSCP